MLNFTRGENLTRTDSQSEMHKRLKARVKEFINKRSVGVNVLKPAITEIADFLEDLLIEYVETIKELDDKRKVVKLDKLDINDEKFESKKAKILKESITLEIVVDARDLILKRKLGWYLR